MFRPFTWNRETQHQNRIITLPVVAMISFSVLIMAIFLGGCSRDESAAVNPLAQEKPATSEHLLEDSILCQVRGDTLVVTHQDAYYQCCLEAKILVHRSGYTLDIVEYDIGQPCDCMCTFDLTTRIVGLQSGTYTVEVWSETGQFFGTCSVTIPSGPVLSGMSQSDCQDYPKAAAAAALHDSIVVTYECGVLTVHHFNAFYNCCFGIEMDFNPEGAVLNFIERPSGEPCYCMCYFHLTASVVNLAPGTYHVRLWNEDCSSLFGEADIIIPPGTAFKSGTVSDEPPEPKGGWWYESHQYGCKDVPKQYQSSTVNSYRMRQDVSEGQKPERRNLGNAHAYYVDGDDEGRSTRTGGN